MYSSRLCVHPTYELHICIDSWVHCICSTSCSGVKLRWITYIPSSRLCVHPIYGSHICIDSWVHCICSTSCSGVKLLWITYIPIWRLCVHPFDVLCVCLYSWVHCTTYTYTFMNALHYVYVYIHGCIALRIRIHLWVYCIEEHVLLGSYILMSYLYWSITFMCTSNLWGVYMYVYTHVCLTLKSTPYLTLWQKSPMKETIFCKRALWNRRYSAKKTF